MIELAEFWRMEIEVASFAEVPVIGATRATVGSSLAVTLRRTVGGWVQEQEVCTSRVLDARKLVKTLLPDAFVDALPLARFPVHFEQDAGGWRYIADFGFQAVGWSGVGALPAVAADPRVTDFDQDGHPGATVLIEAPIVGTGEVYVVQSGRTLADGRLGADGAIEGRLRVVDFGQQVLGASMSLLEHGPRVSPDDARSRFRMEPASGPGCR